MVTLANISGYRERERDPYIPSNANRNQPRFKY